MKTAGIIAEYNPFHNGHAHHIERTRAMDGEMRATHVAVVMSGNFTQRGEPALLPKAQRVQMALAGGADLVLELPLPWALSSAEGFAFGAVSVLNALGCVDILSFGSECGNTAALQKAAEACEHPRFSALLRHYMEGGASFPAAREQAVNELAGPGVASLLQSANNTLGVEYIKALRRLDSPIVPMTIPRFGVEHDGRLPHGDIASASYLRELLRADRLSGVLPFMPSAVAEILAETVKLGQAPSEEKRLERAVLATLRTRTAAELAASPGISEGLENRFFRTVQTAQSLGELIDTVKTKRYTRTRIKRLLWSAFLDVKDGLAQQQPPYVRVLGLGEHGGEILSAARSHGSTLPLLSRASQLDNMSAEAQAVFALEARAADLYALSLPSPFPCGSEYTLRIGG